MLNFDSVRRRMSVIVRSGAGEFGSRARSHPLKVTGRVRQSEFFIYLSVLRRLPAVL